MGQSPGQHSLGVGVLLKHSAFDGPPDNHVVSKSLEHKLGSFDLLGISENAGSLNHEILVHLKSMHFHVSPLLILRSPIVIRSITLGTRDLYCHLNVLWKVSLRLHPEFSGAYILGGSNRRILLSTAKVSSWVEHSILLRMY